MTLVSKREDQTTSAALTEAADVVLSFGASMMRAGNTASRTREWVEVVARKLGFDAVSVSLSLVPRMAMTVALIVILVPGINAFEMTVSLNRGQMLEALQASATFWFVVVALAVGLATALFFTPRQRA